MNASVPPGEMEGSCGVIAIAASAAFVTVRFAPPDTDPEVAVMFVLPLLNPLASPPELIEATWADDEFQLTELVRFCVLPSLKKPVAENC